MLHFIPTPIGNLEDISVRSLNLLASCEVLFCEDTRVGKRLINLLKDRYTHLEFRDKKYISMHSHNEDSVILNLDQNIFKKDVAYISDAGMPSISDPGCKLVNYAMQNGIEFEVLPGANAALLAYVASGFCSSEFLFVGFLPHKKERKDKLLKALNSGYVTILYESPHRIKKLVEELASLAPTREIFLIKEATKLHEKRLKGSSIQIKEMFDTINTKGEWVVVLDALEVNLGVINVEDILDLHLPKKQASKLISKITGKSIKECYNDLV